MGFHQPSGGRRPVAGIEIAAVMEGISKATLRRAKKTLGVISEQRDGGWHWELPAINAQGVE